MTDNTGNTSQRQTGRSPAPTLLSGPNVPTSPRYSSSLDGRSSGGERNTQPPNRFTEKLNTRYQEVRVGEPSMSRPGHATRRADVSSHADSTWVDMQNTLEEVELNAASGSSVFSSDHARSLEGLRKAQVALAQAWAQSDADDEVVDEAGALAGQSVAEVGHKWRNGSARRGAIHISEPVEGSTHSDTGRAAPSRDQAELEQDTENDIMLARRRRQANDEYFDRVNRAVVDVVAKLETVAQKMRDVEVESQSIWNTENDAT